MRGVLCGWLVGFLSHSLLCRSSDRVSARRSRVEDKGGRDDSELMDSDENKDLRTSNSIPISGRGKKPESDLSPVEQGVHSEEDEQLGEDLFGAREDEGSDEEEVRGGLFGEDDMGEANPTVSANARRLADLVMQVDPGRAFNPHAGGGSRWKEYLTGLESGDEMAQLDSLINLADELCVMTEETANGFKLDQFLPPLVLLLNASDNPNTVLLACRCMSHILEALPGSENAFVRNDAIPGLVEKLLNIEYDDLRDQAMNVLSRLCQSPLSASAVLKNGGLCAILANLDFSAINTQVVAVTCAANMLRIISADSWPQIRDALPTLAMLLQYEDQRLVEKATSSLASICTQFLPDPSKLEAVVSSGALPNLIRLVTERVERGSEVSNLTWMVIRCLATLCRGLPNTAEMLIATGVPSILKNMLLAERENATKGIRQSAKTNTQAVYDMVALADQLLPPLPNDIAVYFKSPQTQPTFSTGRSRGLFQAFPVAEIDVLASGSIPIPSDGTSPETDARTTLYKSQPSTLLQVSECLLGTMTLVFGSRVNPQLRVKCLSTITKIVFACTPEMLASLLKDLTFSSFLASLLGSKDLKFIAIALAIAEKLMSKLPDIFSSYFTREGVVHEIESIIACGALFKPASRTSTPSATPSGVSISSTPVDSSITPLTPTSAPSFMWEALASPPNPSMMKARFGGKDTASLRVGSPGAQPISFGASPPAQGSPVPVSFGFGQPSTSTDPSTPQPSKPSSHIKVLDASSPAAPLTPATPNSSSEPSSDSSSSFNQTELLRVEVLERCTQFKQTYFAVDGATSEGLDELSTLTEALTVCLWSEKDAKKLKALLEKVSALFLNGISTHEFVRSELPTAIFQLLTLKDEQAPIPRHERISMFVYTFGKRAKSEAKDAAILSPWTQLVKELHNAIDKNENFQVKLNPAMTNGGIRANTIVEFLTKAFSIKLLRDPSEKTLPAIYEGPVSVEPLATGRSIKEFVLNKVNHAVSQEAKRKADAEKKQAAEAAAAEAAANPVASRTRSRAEDPATNETAATTPTTTSKRGKKSLATSSSLTASSASSSSAAAPSDSENTQTTSYDDIEEDEGLEVMDEDIDHGDQGVFVQDVDGTESTDNASSSSEQASAAVATPKRGRPQAYPLSALILTVNGVPLGDTVSIFKALKEKSADEVQSTDSEVASPLAPMWSQVHDLHYRLVADVPSPAASPSVTSPTSSTPKRSKSRKSRSADESSEESSPAAAPTAEVSSDVINTPQSIMRRASEGAALDRVLDRLMLGAVGETCGFEKTLVQLLSLMQVLMTINSEVPRLLPGLQFNATGEDIVTVPASDFINAKLTAKLARQLQDPLALCTNTLPAWCNSLCSELPFLFPLDLRQLYFRGSSLGVPRALMALKDRVEGVLDGNFGRIPPHKVRVARDSIPQLNTAFVVLQRMRSDSRSILEVEYANEVATGAGPTLEFYTLVSHAFQQSKFNMWVADGADKIIKHSPRARNSSPKEKSKSTKSPRRSSSSSGMDVDEEASISAATPSEAESKSRSNKKSKRSRESKDSSKTESAEVSSSPAEFLQIVSNNGGLFPRPLLADSSSNTFKETVKRFSYLGTFIAKAIMDDRMMDMPFSVAFFKALLGQPLQLDDLESVYPQLVATIKEFMALVEEKKAIEADKTIDTEMKSQRIRDIKYKGGSVEDMWLTFEMPGSQEELVRGGAQRDVTIHNLAEWIDLVVDALAGKGIQAQFDAIREGFNFIFPVEKLSVFEPTELETLMCGSIEQDWSKEAILDAANYTHGFTVHSKVSQWFATLLSSFDEEQRRKFLRFATGSPRLPPRGFKGFHHRLTLSRKDAEKSHSADDYYPSVSTCFLFIKIPEYSSYELFKERFLTAVENGQQGFGLS